jgi:hypothetical protein
MTYEEARAAFGFRLERRFFEQHLEAHRQLLRRKAREGK